MTKEGGLKKQILLPLALALAGLCVFFVVSSYLEEKEHIAQEFRRNIQTMQENYRQALRTEAARFTSVINTRILADARVRAALVAGDRAELLRLLTPLYQQLRAIHGLTHLYLNNAAGVNVVRAHIPEWYGDKIRRYVSREAEQTGATAWGMELGNTGTFTLRVVVPWYSGGRRIGYVELGREIEQVLRAELEHFRLGFLVLLDKEHLKRAEWERGMALLGRRAEWERFEHVVVSQQTLATLPPDVTRRLAQLPVHADAAEFEAVHEGRHYYAIFVPLIDASRHPVGELLALEDVTERLAGNRVALLWLAAVYAVVGLLLFAAFYVILDRVERQLAGSRRRLEEEGRAREAIQARYVEKLEREQAILRESRDAIEEAHREWTMAFDVVHDLLFLHDKDLRLMRANRAYLEQAGMSLEQAAGQPYWRVFPRLDGPMSGCLHAMAERSQEEAEELWLDTGQVFLCRDYPIHDSQGAYLYSLHIMQDVTERKRFEHELQYQATHDALTGLPNRNLLTDRLEQAIAHAHRSGKVVATMLLDLDRFKVINDSLGHDTGDSVLKLAAGRFSTCIRDGDTLARLGGDEFVMILADVAAPDDVAQVAYRALQILAHPLTVAGQEIVVTTSIGVSLYPRDGDNAEALLKHADIAMYRAKERGRDNVQFYTQEMNIRTRERLELEADLRHALERGELRLHYQPQVELHSGRIVGAEALLRWEHPSRGTILPDRFIPVAEETGSIVAIGEWVLDTACTQIRRWREEGLPAVRVAVNLSPRQLKQQNLPDAIVRALGANGLDPRYLELELTESAVMHDPDEAIALLKQLRSLGPGLSLDDFGTGYSSLNHLKRLPIHELKIDRSFVHDITFAPDGAAIVAAIIALAHGLGLEVVAEGVETTEQLHYLRRHRCNLAQGFYFSAPLPAGEFAALLRAGTILRPEK